MKSEVAEVLHGRSCRRCSADINDDNPLVESIITPIIVSIREVSSESFDTAIFYKSSLHRTYKL